MHNPPTLQPPSESTLASAVVFVNRMDGGNNARASGASVSLIAPNASALSVGTLTTATVTVLNFPNNAQTGPIYPSSSLAPASVQALQTTTLNLNTYVRFINITAAPGKCLFFRELYALDNTFTNVALFKPTTQGGFGQTVSSYRDANFGFVSFPSYGVDGIIDVSASADACRCSHRHFERARTSWAPCKRNRRRPFPHRVTRAV